MTPTFCTITHDPENGKYADCVRACVASVLDLPTEQVPHFYHDDAPWPIPMERMREWLLGRGLAPWVIHFDGVMPIDDLHAMVAQTNPLGYYILWGSTAHGDHVVIGQGGKIVFDPAWYKSPMTGPASNGFWSIMLIVAA